MTIQLLAKDDHFGDDSITSEEKWSLYVDHFVQLQTTESSRIRKREPFLKRNLPYSGSIPDDATANVETKSGLELKICLNTYKIFFVNNTEDYFVRRGIDKSRHQAELKSRHEKFRAWLDSSNGWKKFVPSKQSCDAKEEEFEQWVAGGDISIITEQDEGRHFRKFVYESDNLLADEDNEDNEMDVDQE